MAPARAAAEVQLDPFARFVLEAAGLEAEAYRAAALNRRLPACLRVLRASDGAAARLQLQRNPALLPKALNALLLGVTGFCRDARVFHSLEKRILPDLLSRMRKVRIWSAACSDGQELYSVALLLSQLDGLKRAQLVGTDCRPDAISRARLGHYPAALLEGLYPECRDRCFVRVGELYQVREEIRRSIRWEMGDLMQGSACGEWDLVLWRNMAIYLRPEPARRLWTEIVECLSPGGYLIVGRAERPPTDLPVRRVESCIYEKTAVAHQDR